MLALLLVLTALLLRRAPASSSAVEAAVENGTRVIGSPQRPYRLITATSGFETYPTLSPDGSLVAYEGANEDGNGGGAIKVQTSGNAPARQLLVPRPVRSIASRTGRRMVVRSPLRGSPPTVAARC